MQEESPHFPRGNRSGGGGRESALPVLKGRLPFRLATTSYIIPAAIIPNLHFLGPLVDEVELVLFESEGQENLPSADDLLQMRDLAYQYDLTYNVHLPSDVFLGDPSRLLREKHKEIIVRFYERALPLDPTVYILHLDSRSANGAKSPDRDAWMDRVRESTESLMREGLDPRRVAVENLEYPLAWVRPLVEATGLTYCLDIGHLLRYGHDVQAEMSAFLTQSAMVHLHGVRNGVDHLRINWIADEDWSLIRRALMEYTGTVSLEVFSVEDLRHSFYKLSEDLKEKEKDEAGNSLAAD